MGEKANIEVHVAAYNRAIGHPIPVIVDRMEKRFKDQYIVEEVVKRLGERDY